MNFGEDTNIQTLAVVNIIVNTIEGFCHLNTLPWTSLVVQWVRLCAPSARDPDSIPGWGTRSCMHATTKSPHAATKKDPACRDEDPVQPK